VVTVVNVSQGNLHHLTVVYRKVVYRVPYRSATVVPVIASMESNVVTISNLSFTSGINVSN